MFKDIMEKLDKIEPLLELSGNEQLKISARFIAERIAHPDSYVTFLGETSSGKSTLINGLLGKQLLPVKACPSTGAITEVELCSDDREDYYAINKDASIERIGRVDFTRLAECPDSELQRVKLCINSPNPNLNHMRIFDTPGYGSIVKEHEEILKEFLPNSDVVIYTVAYKIGIQEEDYAFLGFLKELVREDAEIILVINRCRTNDFKNDLRINEIFKYVSGRIGTEPKMFCIPEIISKNENDYPLPMADELWEYTASSVNSEEHVKNLHMAFEEYVFALYKACDSAINMRYAQACIDSEGLKAIIDEQKKTAEHIRKAVPNLIDPAFDKMAERLPVLFDRAEEAVIAKVNEEINDSDTGKMEEMIGFTTGHLLPYNIKKENSEIQYYLETELTRLNEDVSDYINKEIEDFSNEIAIRLNTHTEAAVNNVAKKVIARLTTNGLNNVFKGFGGAGGANAGIANAASHLLKKLGNLFGKTFSRETHNSLKHFLAKIGATSMKAVGSAITVVLELIMLVFEYSTWKTKLKQQISKGVRAWKEETVQSSLNDLEALRQENIKNIREIAAEMDCYFTENNTEDIDELKKAAELSQAIGTEIGAL